MSMLPNKHAHANGFLESLVEHHDWFVYDQDGAGCFDTPFIAAASKHNPDWKEPYFDGAMLMHEVSKHLGNTAPFVHRSWVKR